MRSFSFLLLGCLTGLSSAVAAPGPTPGDRDLIRERQERLLEEQRRRLEELKELPGKQLAPTAPTTLVDSPCFPIDHIEIKGAARDLCPFLGTTGRDYRARSADLFAHGLLPVIQRLVASRN
jgi:hemolysin activation/secretion protein